MSKVKKIAINGFGRIGRAALKIILEKKDLKVVAINDLTDNKTLAHLLANDSVYGNYNQVIKYNENELIIGKHHLQTFAKKDPKKLPWKKLAIDVVLECTGLFKTSELVKPHLKAGAKKVIISAPPKSEDIKNIVLGVNFNDYNPATDNIISCASCTTNCMAPLAKILHQKFGIIKGLANTIHSYTSSQRLVDGPHKDLRRARSAALNIVPTTTGSAIAVTKVIPKLTGCLDAIAYRVPTPCASIVELVVELKQVVTIEKVNNAFRNASKKDLFGILAVDDNELVSSDYIGNPHSATVDLKLTNVVGDNLVKVVAWYDNEWGYSNRLVELAEKI